jgi:hypothetical protein
MVELGRLDIYVHIALLSSYLVQPRRGHLEAIYNIYGYLKHSTMVFDDAPIEWKDIDFPKNDCRISIMMQVNRFLQMHPSLGGCQYKLMPLWMKIMLITM